MPQKHQLFAQKVLPRAQSKSEFPKALDWAQTDVAERRAKKEQQPANSKPDLSIL